MSLRFLFVLIGGGGEGSNKISKMDPGSQPPPDTIYILKFTKGIIT